MEKKTIGAFIAALRKANGMTQQELADRLGVSNKAVSRWERDENAPDLSLIPAIAEIFGVTCDELLKGERIFHDAEEPTKSEPKVDKQLKALVNRSTSTFKTIIYIAIALAVIGLVAMVGIPFALEATRDAEDIFQNDSDYANIGLAIMLLFEIISLMLTAIATSRMIDTRRNNELFENPDTVLLGRYNRVLSSYSYLSFFTTLSAVVISQWFFGCWTDKLDDYISLEKLDYSHVLAAALLLLATIFLSAKECYAALLTGQKYVSERKKMHPAIVKLNRIQLSCAFFAYICLIIRPLFYNPVDTDSPLFDPSIIASRPYFYKILYIILPCIAIVLLLAVLILFAIFLYRHKPQKNNILFYGLRNIAYLALTPVACALFDVSWEYQRETASMVRLVHFSFDNLIVLLTWLLRIFLFSFLIKILLRRKNKL